LVLLAAVLTIMPAAWSGSLQWTFAGPYGANGSSAGVTSGRVSAMVVDPRDRNTVYASGAQGGVWKTTDGGNNWKPLTDDQPTLAIGSLALDPSNPDIIYAGTGEETFSPASPPAFGGAFYGMGVLKSTDRGATWTLYNGPFAGPFGPTFYDGGARIGSLAVSPSNSQVILAAADFHNPAKSGIYRSADGGVTWTLVLGGASGTEALFNPSNGSTTAWAALGDPKGNTKNGIYRSADGGLTWALNFSPGSDAGRIRLTISSNGSVLYAGVHSVSTGGALGIWKTSNGGSGWGHLTNAPEYCRDTCYYHNVIGVSPVNANTVVAAGLTPRRSLDGGGTWTDLYLDKNDLTIHPDSHALAWSADGTRLYVGTDGGVYSTDDLASTPNTFTSLNATLGITQYYQGMSIHPSDPTITFAGSQDNGTMKSGSPQWLTVDCGDGGRTLIDPSTPNTVYTSCAGGPLPQKSVDGGVTFSDSFQGINDERTSFWAPFTMDPSNHTRLYYGTYRVYVSNNAGASWAAISGDLTGTGPIFALTTITVSPSSSNTVYAACGNDGTPPEVWISTNATSGTSSTWTNRSAGLPQRPPSQIAVDATNPQVAYISFMGFSGYNGDTAGHVFRTTNGGAAWSDISGNLPNTEVNDLLLDPSLPSTIYAATDIGVFWTLDGGVHWTQLGTGLPRMEVMALALHQPSRTLRAATYGRSMWDLHIPLPSPVIPKGAIVNSAWPVSGAAVAPGSIASMYGTSLALDTLLVSAPWPQALGGASILTNGKPAAMFYVSPGQINFQVPWEAAGSTQGSVSITTGGIPSAAQSFNLAGAAPGLFTTNQQGTGQAAALVANTAIVAAPTGMFPGSRPVKRGVEYLEFYGTGLGPVTHTPATGAAAPANPLAQTIASATVTIGGVSAPVTYCGLSPNYVGLYQVDVQVPANAPTGSAVAVSLSIGGVAANTVTVAVQ
jgi:uncharacterized protein (TIGR03437 family)